jgi:steroid delta-isomerase-like uncharacterized protein
MGPRAVESENKALIRRWFDEVWNQGRQEAIDQLRAPDAVATGLGERNARSEGPEPFKAFFTNLRAALPDLRVRIEDILAEEDKIAVRLSGEGTHRGSGFGVAPSGRRVQVTGITIIRIADGKIVEAWNSLDQLGLLTQLGVVPGHTGPDRFLTTRS